MRRRWQYGALAVLILAAAPAYAQAPVEPPCGFDGEPKPCASITSGAVTVATRDGHHEYATAGAEVDVPYKGWVIYGTGDAWAVQDGAALDQGTTTSFRAVQIDAGASKAWGAFQLRAHGAVTFSVEGAAGAPIDPRQWSALATVDYLVDGGHVSAFVGHDGAVGGTSVGVDVELPVAGGRPSIVARYELPLVRPLNGGPLPWVITIGARIRVASFRLGK